MRANLPLRVIRAAAFAVVCVLLAVVAHRFAGGAGPTANAMLVGGLAVMAAAAALAGRERSPATVVGLLVSAQVLLHFLLGSSLAPAFHVHDVKGGLGAAVGMIAAHGTASLLTGWWVAQGEAALWAVLRRAYGRALRLLLPVSTVFEPVGAASAPVWAEAPRPRRLILRHAIPRRGPPVLSAF
ncbi:MFS transporter [Streptosporangiaceae bacterium NEAU-GS5]|nr:MFS transporter [Streptosporangiaceae bacterium NEAU-GS5]